MSWKSIYQDMAFTPYKTEMAAHRELQDSVKILYYFIQGQAKQYEVYEALRHLDYVSCSHLIRRETKKFRDCMYWEDESAREAVCKEALGAIIRCLEKHGVR
jgi:hypothetical protein